METHQAAQTQQLRTAPDPSAFPLLVDLVRDRALLMKLRAAAEAIAGEEADVEFLRQVLGAAGFHVPLADTPEELVARLPQKGWRPIPTHYGPPATGLLFVQAKGDGKVLRVGLVGVLHHEKGSGVTLRDYFRAVAPGSERGERVEVADVQFWLVPPGIT